MPKFDILPGSAALEELFCTELKVDGEEVVVYTAVPMTRRQIRKEMRDIRNRTHFIFDGFSPPALRDGFYRMKGARQAYTRRAGVKPWPLIEGDTSND